MKTPISQFRSGSNENYLKIQLVILGYTPPPFIVYVRGQIGVILDN